MSIKTSTGLRNGMLVTGSFKSLMDSCTLKIYDGVEPATADAALNTNNLLVEIKNAGAALTFEAAAASGVVSKTPAEVWASVILLSGTASFYRLEANGDTGGDSDTEIRYQGSVAVAGSDLNLSSIALTAGATQNIDHFSVALPTI